MRDLRLALDRLARRPTFTVLAVSTLAIGLGAFAAIYSIVDAVLLRPLPYPDAGRLVAIEHAAPGLDLAHLEMSGPLYLHYRQHNRSFDGPPFTELPHTSPEETRTSP